MTDVQQVIRDRLGENPSYRDYVAVEKLVRTVTNDAPDGTVRVRLAVLGNYTLQPVMPVIRAELALNRILIEDYVGRFDAVFDEALNPDSGFRQLDADAVILSLWLEALAPDLAVGFTSLDRERIKKIVDDAKMLVGHMLDALRETSLAPIFLNNFPLPVCPAYGALDASIANGQVDVVERLNIAVREIAATFPNVWLVDLRQCLAVVGSAHGLDERLWQMARAPLAQKGCVAAGQLYARLLAAWQGRTRKCLILDCDNTLWGGVIGEDGLNGILLGGDYPGNCFVAFQHAALELHDRGIILALCSRNNEVDVMQVLQKHPSSILREEHFATWEINWDDKVTNLRRLAQRLNIGLDSFVFVDDSPFECDAVRSMLPQVDVIQLMQEPSTHSTRLRQYSGFDTLVMSAEDRQRNRMYRADISRRQMRSDSATLQHYLMSLELRADIHLVRDREVARVAQLTRKTNQFNLTTRRRTEGEIKALLDNDEFDVFCITLSDRMSGLGIIGVAIVRYDQEVAVIDTFLLSCRALGRGAEHALLSRVVDSAATRKCTRICGLYRPTAKNGQVAEFYPRLGFRTVAFQEGDVAAWELPVSEAIECPEWIRIEGREI